MPSLYEIDLEARMVPGDRLLDRVFLQEVKRFEDWAAVAGVASTHIDQDGAGIYYQARDDAGNSWFPDRDTADLLVAHYDAAMGLYEVLFTRARLEGIRRRVRDKRVRRMQVAELKAQAEW